MHFIIRIHSSSYSCIEYVGFSQNDVWMDTLGKPLLIIVSTKQKFVLFSHMSTMLAEWLLGIPLTHVPSPVLHCPLLVHPRASPGHTGAGTPAMESAEWTRTIRKA